MKEAKTRFNNHRQTAKCRGIEFKFSFDEWYSWWLANGVDKNYPTQAKGGKQPCMCRYGDMGPYEIANVFCGTNSQNVREANLGRTDTRKRTVTPIGVFDSSVFAAEALNISRKKLWTLMRKFPTEYRYAD